MIADIRRPLVPRRLRLLPCRIRRVVHNNGGLAALYDMYRDPVRAAERNDLRLPAPDRGVAHARAVPLELPAAHEACLRRACRVLARLRGQERQEVVRVRVDEVGGGAPACRVCRLGGGEDVEERELVRDGGEEAVPVWVDLEGRGRRVGGAVSAEGGRSDLV